MRGPVEPLFAMSAPTLPLKNVLALIGLLCLAALSRLLPHPPNFVPVGAMALFGAAVLPQRWLAVVLPLAAFYLSDLVLNNTVYATYFSGFYWGIDLWVYGGVALMVVLGLGLLRQRSFSWLRIGGAAVAATLGFFLVTTFGVWAAGSMYPKSGAGLLLAYAAGLPFLLNSLLANLLFSGAMFGVARYFGWLEQDRVRATATLRG